MRPFSSNPDVGESGYSFREIPQGARPRTDAAGSGSRFSSGPWIGQERNWSNLAPVAPDNPLQSDRHSATEGDDGMKKRIVEVREVLETARRDVAASRSKAIQGDRVET